MKTNILNYFLLAVFSISLFTTSCKKDEEEKKIDNDTTTAQDNAIAQNAFDDIKKVVEEAADDEGKTSRTSYTFGTCASVTITPAWIDTTTWPKTMTIDFGTSNCTGNDGVNRRGKLIVTLSDNYRDSGSVLTVQPQSYYVNDHLVEGTKTITNNGRNTSGNLSFTVQVTNGKVTFPGGGSATWASTRTNEWIAGESTTLFSHGIAGVCDDVYLITGSANGISRAGKAYSVNIVTPLRKEICCKWLVSGVVDIIPSGLATRTVNFGGGACDNIATVTILGNVFTFTMG
ncbi:MAG: hypothetical protein IT232_03640 [Flavobacteriales bacterium]|nr:hypothetical protein [Flavobacteriales bacterium]